MAATYTPRQGQFLAFIHQYTNLNGHPPAEADMQRYFGTSAPAVHRMVVALEDRGLIRRTPGAARSIRLLVPADHLPDLGTVSIAEAVSRRMLLPQQAKRPKTSPLLGRWRITEMEVWDREYIDAEVKAYIRFDPNGFGEFQFAYVSGSIDYRLVERDGRTAVEWSWDGNAEMDQVSGRGWAVLGQDGRLTGRLFIHDGDDSGFTAKRAGEPRRR